MKVRKNDDWVGAIFSPNHYYLDSMKFSNGFIIYSPYNRLMKFLVYTAEPTSENATLESFQDGADKEMSRLINQLREMDLERVLENRTVDVLVDNVQYNKHLGLITADIYKQTTPGKALHQLAEDGDGITIQEIISDNEDAFVQGMLGAKKIEDELHLLVENNFGSFFVSACNGIDTTPQYSSETIQSIQDSETIGRTTIDFADGLDLEASLLKPPEDGDVRDDDGFGNINVANKIISLLDISSAHRMSFDITRDEWLENVDLFDELIESGIATRVRVEETKDGIVKLGKGGDRAIRRTVNTPSGSEKGLDQGFKNLAQ